MIAIGFIRQFQNGYRDLETILGGDLLLLRRFYVLFGAVFICILVYPRLKEICNSYLNLLNSSTSNV